MGRPSKYPAEFRQEAVRLAPCSLPIKTVLVDDMQRNFDPIQDLYKVEGNPE